MSETDLISRQAAIDAILEVTGKSSVRELSEYVQEHRLAWTWSGGVNAAIDIIISVPSAHPELNEWCHDCKEYDHDNHCCPRWNRVIRTTLEDAHPDKAYEKGWEDGREALREELWKDGRDRLN